MEAMRRAGIMDASNIRVAVQGFGNVGSHAAYYAHENGFKVVAVSDVRGGIYNANGLHVPSVMEHQTIYGTVVGYPGAEAVTNAELLEVPCDVLIPAALENQISEKNADRIKAKFVIEGANGPTTPEADDILNGKGVTVVPDVLANAGGVIVSYFEWVQDLQAFFWTEEEVFRKMDPFLIRAYEVTSRMSEEKGIDMRTAAQVTAIKRVGEALKTRGFYP